MLHQIRSKNGEFPKSGTLVEPGLGFQSLLPMSFRISSLPDSVTGIRSLWGLALPFEFTGFCLDIQQEMFIFWVFLVTIQGVIFQFSA